PEYKEIKTTLGIPKSEKVISHLKPMVRNPVFRDGEEKGEIDPDRPRRLPAKIWIAKPKETSTAKAKAAAKGKEKELKSLPTEGAEVPGERMLCTFEMMDGTPIAMEELYERPFDAVFTIVWTADFFGAKSACQLKISNISVCKLLEKNQQSGLTEEERDDIRDQYAALRAEEEDEESGPVTLAPPKEEEDEEKKEEETPAPKKESKKKETKAE